MAVAVSQNENAIQQAIQAAMGGKLPQLPPPPAVSDSIPEKKTVVGVPGSRQDIHTYICIGIKLHI